MVENSRTTAPSYSELLSVTKAARAKIEELQQRLSSPIAIIGIGCRFPGGVESADQFWEFLSRRDDGIGSIPPDRWNCNGLINTAKGPTAGQLNSDRGGFIDNVDCFDPGVFNISGHEAKYMDPQQRLVLQSSWHALEHAGIIPKSLARSKTGVFIGAGSCDYARLQVHFPQSQLRYSGTGNSPSIIANRLSYLFDLSGPSMVVDTACSSSLVAVHLAIRSLRSGESDLAIAGGVNVILNPDLGIILSQAGMLSPSGRCHSFDASADGYVRSEGVGVLVLKRLCDAQRDKNRILAVLRGSAMNQDGHSNSLTAPNGLAQQDVVTSAWHDSGLEQQGLGYIEAHGTGTPLGDPIELNSLAKSAGQRSDNKKVMVGSVKSSLGHLEPAAGVAGLIKVVLSMRAGTIPAQAHLDTPNPYINIHDSALQLMGKDSLPWPEQQALAGVSSFGFGGTNAHVVLERFTEADSPVPNGDAGSESSIVLAISACSRASLVRSSLALAKQLETGKYSPPALAAALQRYRGDYAHRIAIPCNNRNNREIASSLRKASQGLSSDARIGRRPGSRPLKVILQLSEEQPRSTLMIKRLAEGPEVFRHALRQSAQLLTPWLETDLASLCARPSGKLSQTEAQALSFAAQYTLLQALIDCGIDIIQLVAGGRANGLKDAVSGLITFQDAAAIWMNTATQAQAQAQASHRTANPDKHELTALCESILSDSPEVLQLFSGDFGKPDASSNRFAADHLLCSSDGIAALFSALYARGIDLPQHLFENTHPAPADALPLYDFQLDRYWMVAGEPGALAQELTARRLNDVN